MTRREHTQEQRDFKSDAPRIDTPIAGYYRVKLVKGGPWTSARLWYGLPRDPITGEELDRSPRWMGERGGQPCELEDLWPFCHGNEIDQAEYDYLAAVEKWATNAPGAPEHDPRKAIDHMQGDLIF